MRDDAPPPNADSFRPLALTLVLIAAAIALVRSVPGLLPWNLTPVGAIALFTGARLRGWPLLIPFAVMALSDILLWWVHDNPPFNLLVYLSFGVYALLGATLLRRAQAPELITGVAFLASAQFFLVTNFGAWLDQAHPYPLTFAGLVECYTLALPFYRNLLAGDLLFTVALFALHAALAHAYFPAERVAPAGAAE